MKKMFLAVIILLCISSNVPATLPNNSQEEAQNAQVANYETGRLGTNSYEHFAFWVKDGAPLEVVYGYGKDWYLKDIKPTYVGPAVVKGARGFKLQFPNGRLLYVTPVGNSLRVTDGSVKYAKSFRWAYEGPRDGRGTACTPCAEGPKEAMELLRAAFLK